MLEQRVASLEERLVKLDMKIDRIDEALRRIEPAIRDIGSKFSDFGARVAGVEGQMKAMPTFLQLAVALITTWSAGAAIVFALMKALH